MILPRPTPKLCGLQAPVTLRSNQVHVRGITLVNMNDTVDVDNIIEKSLLSVLRIPSCTDKLY